MPVTGIAMESPVPVVTVMDWLKGPVGANWPTATVNGSCADPLGETMAGPTVHVSHGALGLAVTAFCRLVLSTKTSRWAGAPRVMLPKNIADGDAESRPATSTSAGMTTLLRTEEVCPDN